MVSTLENVQYVWNLIDHKPSSRILESFELSLEPAGRLWDCRMWWSLIRDMMMTSTEFPFSACVTAGRRPWMLAVSCVWLAEKGCGQHLRAAPIHTLTLIQSQRKAVKSVSVSQILRWGVICAALLVIINSRFITKEVRFQMNILLFYNISERKTWFCIMKSWCCTSEWSRWLEGTDGEAKEICDISFKSFQKCR